MELELCEGVTHYRAQAVAHETLALEAGECVVTEIAAAKWAKYGVGEIDDPDHLTGAGYAHEESGILWLGHARDVTAELRWCGWRGSPRMVKCAASPSESQELSLIGERGSSEMNARHVCALTLR